MVLKNKDINLLIKMENLIGMNEKTLFGEDNNKKCIVNWYDGTTTVVDKNDFLNFMALIERALKDKQEMASVANNYKKIPKNRKRANIIQNINNAKHRNDKAKIDYWTKKLEEYKKEVE